MNLIDILREQKQMKMKGGLYHKVQIDLTYNSNHIEGSKLTHDQTRFIFETNTIGIEKNTTINVDDIIETSNHFRCIDYLIDHVLAPLSEDFIKQLHFILKQGTSDSRKDWFNVGEYKRLPNEVGGKETTLPEAVQGDVQTLLRDYNAFFLEVERTDEERFNAILDFHQRFEGIHPFQDGNGRVGRLIMFKECLAHDIVPFIITEELRFFYYRGLREWPEIPGYLRDTCLTAQDEFKSVLKYYRVEY